jgi:hypothetical protein
MTTAEFIAAVGFVAAAGAAFAAFLQLRDTKNIARGQFILAIDQSLAPFEFVRRQVEHHHAPTDEKELRRYIAALERIGLLLQKGYLDIEAVERCYGSRLKRLINSTEPDYVQLIIKNVNKEGGWKDFVWLWDHMREPLKLRAIPPSSTDG